MIEESIQSNVSINPLRLSPPLGAILAFLGMEKTISVLHGSQGCAAFSKTLLTRHFREPIPLQTTALRQEQVIMGSANSMEETLQALITKHQPQVIGLITTALTETAGDDVDGMIRSFQSTRPTAPPIIVVHASEYKGSLTNGYVMALNAMVDGLMMSDVDEKPPSDGKRLVNLVFGPSSSPGEVDDIKELFRTFGYHPLVFPDLSTSLDGHLGSGLVGTTVGGLSITDRFNMRHAELTFSFAKSVAGVGRRIASLANSPHLLVSPLTSLAAMDEFVKILSLASGRKVPVRLLHERDRLMDRMVDAHSYFAGQRIVLAGEPDWLYATEMGLTAMGARIVEKYAAVSPESCGHDTAWKIGDFDQLERDCQALAPEQRPGLLLSNSHGKQSAQRLGIEFLSMGLPVWDRLGVPLESGVLYRGMCDWITRVGNVLLQAQEKKVHERTDVSENCICHA